MAKRIRHGYDGATVSAGRASLQVSSYQFEDFELDLRRYELRRDGLALRLERIPMELLILLLSRNGELVSREEIVEKLWGKDVFVETEHSVNTAVRKIRQALADDPESPRFVKTIKGKGYRFAGNISFQPGGSRSEPVEMPGEVVMPHEIQQRLPDNSNVVETLSWRRHRFTVPLEKVISPRAPVLAPEPPSRVNQLE